MMEGAYVKVKSKKISMKKKYLVLWLVVVFFFSGILAFLIYDYASYKEGQEFGVSTSLIVDQLLSGNSPVNPSSSYDEQCEDLYNSLKGDDYYSLYSALGIDNSALKDLRKTQDEYQDSFYDLMKDGGYARFASFNIYNWFYYTNFIEYLGDMMFFRNNCVRPYEFSYVVLCFYVCFLAVLVWTLITIMSRQKEISIAGDIIICKSGKNTKQILIPDIVSVETGRNSLTIKGSNIKFKITNISNSSELKSAIVDRKKEMTRVDISPAMHYGSDADELKKYKELLDTGVISEEEYEAKKKKILGS